MPDFVAAAADYERWLATFCPIDPDGQAAKAAAMADPFPFLQATYYRWAQAFPRVCPDLAGAPRVLGVGDLHVENFGTWRDADGRLCWGVNDFDEADDVPYPTDLVRLAVSVKLAGVARLRAACDAVLGGYTAALAAGGDPFVLEERHPELRAVGMSADREPGKFWRKLTKVLADPSADPPADVRAALRSLLPAGAAPEYRHRRAGLGSLGRPRYVALLEWRGGWVAREAKAVVPPATAWAAGRAGRSRAAEAVDRAVRSPDPFYRPGPAWVLRRLAPRSSRIELGHLPDAADVPRLLSAMGAEAANVHLGTPGAAAMVGPDLAGRPAGWLTAAAKAMLAAVEADRMAWRGHIGMPTA